MCCAQMTMRIFLTFLLLLESLIRKLLETLYNVIFFMFQICSIIPICVVFFLTAKLRCLLCTGGFYPTGRSCGLCDCVMSVITFVALVFILRATGYLDSILNRFGYTKTGNENSLSFENETPNKLDYSEIKSLLIENFKPKDFQENIKEKTEYFVDPRRFLFENIAKLEEMSKRDARHLRHENPTVNTTIRYLLLNTSDA